MINYGVKMFAHLGNWGQVGLGHNWGGGNQSLGDLSVVRGRRLVGQHEASGLGISHTGSVFGGRVGRTNGRVFNGGTARRVGVVARGVADSLNGRGNTQLHLRLGVAVSMITVRSSGGGGHAQNDKGEELKEKLGSLTMDDRILFKCHGALCIY